MGTRHLTSVIYKQKTVVAQYGQWDGYPTGQGLTIVEFLNNADLDRFKLQLEKTRFTNDKDHEEVGAYLESIGAKGGWMNREQAEKYNKRYPYFGRDHGANILNLILDSKDDEISLHDSSDFINDGLFCEWAYEIDLDKRTLKILNGANETYSFDNLPTKEDLTQVEQNSYDYE
jgi:hypothetical protein